MMYVASASFIIDGQKIAATSESNWFDFLIKYFKCSENMQESLLHWES